MAICPFAVQQIIPESHTQGRITPTTLIFHRAVSSADSLYGYWTSPGVELESHFYVGRDGTIYQFMDTEIRADANMDANAFAISVESWDGGNTPDSMGWNPEQVAANKRLAAWVCDTHDIERSAATAWDGGGIGGHNWFPYPWAGGPRGCPGTERNRQLREEIIPFVASGGSSEPEDEMSWDTFIPNHYGSDVKAGELLAYVDEHVNNVAAEQVAQRAILAAIAKDPTVTAAKLEEVVTKAVAAANAAHLAAQKAQLDATLTVVREIVGARDEDLANEVVDEIGRRTSRTEAA